MVEHCRAQTDLLSQAERENEELVRRLRSTRRRPRARQSTFNRNFTKRFIRDAKAQCQLQLTQERTLRKQI
eukprot:12928754-Prorocentrum_lima.AAC.1